MYVYVLNKHGKPLMPCKPRKARVLLQSGKATVIKKTPFTRIRFRKVATVSLTKHLTQSKGLDFSIRSYLKTKSVSFSADAHQARSMCVH